MKLHYMPGACSMSDHIVLEWIGQPYEAVNATPEARKSAEYLAKNPAGTVPTFEHDGWVLTQNVAILNFLADSAPDAKLLGDGSAKSRADVNRWLAFVNSDIHAAFHPLFGSTGYLGDEALIKKTQDNARANLRTLFGRANAQLEGKDWLTGSRSIADPYLYVVLRWAGATGVDLSGYDNLARFSQRMDADPAVQKVLKDEGIA